MAEAQLPERLLPDLRRYQQIVELATEGIWSIDRDNVTTYVNARMGEMLGYRADDMIGRTLFDFMDHEGRAITERNVGRRKAGIAEEHDFKFQRRDGADVWVRMSTSPNTADDGSYEGATVLVTDITEQRQLRLALEASEARFRVLVNTSPDIITLFSPDGTLRYSSPAGMRILGYPSDFSDGVGFASLVHPDDVESAAAALQELIANDRGNDRPMFFRLRHADGSYRSFESFGMNLVDDPHINGLVLTTRDITERANAQRALAEQRAELERARVVADKRALELRLERALRFESLGRLAGGVAHDFNNLLGAINNYTSVIARELDSHDPLRGDAERILAATERGARLVNDLMVYSEGGAAAPEFVDVDELVGELIADTDTSTHPFVEIVHEPSGVAPVVVMPRLRLEQALLNLLRNAYDAIPDVGTVTIATTVRTVTKAYAEFDLRPGRYVELTVHDTGSGMAPEVVAAAADPFFTTKPPDRGIGLGLAIVQGTARAAGGALQIHSLAGAGSSVTIVLPLHSTADPA